MKRALLILGLAMLLYSLSNAQSYLIFGNRDGSVMTVFAGSTIEVPIWGCTPYNSPESVTYMEYRLSTNDSVISARLGGYFPDPPFNHWQDISFSPPHPNHQRAGWTTQELIGYDDIGEPLYPQDWLWTNGDTVRIGIYRMTVANSESIVGDTILPFCAEGYGQSDTGMFWGAMDGIHNLDPLTTYPRLFILSSGNYTYTPGDANGIGGFTGSDVIFSTRFFKGGPPPPFSAECPADSGHSWFVAGDVNGSCTFSGADITYMVRHFKGGPAPIPCPACMPVGR